MANVHPAAVELLRATVAAKTLLGGLEPVVTSLDDPVATSEYEKAISFFSEMETILVNNLDKHPHEVPEILEKMTGLQEQKARLADLMKPDTAPYVEAVKSGVA